MMSRGHTHNVSPVANAQFLSLIGQSYNVVFHQLIPAASSLSRSRDVSANCPIRINDLLPEIAISLALPCLSLRASVEICALLSIVRAFSDRRQRIALVHRLSILRLELSFDFLKLFSSVFSSHGQTFSANLPLQCKLFIVHVYIQEEISF